MIRAADAIAALETMQFAPVTDVTGGRTTLILAPHADDETLGCGGLIAAAAAAGHPPFVLILTDGTGSHPASRAYPPARLRAVREDEARRAIDRLGLDQDRIAFLGLPDTAAPMEGAPFMAAVAAIQEWAGRVEATTILAPWEHDPHSDHLAAHRMAVASGMHHVSYPVWGWLLPPDMPLAGPLPIGVRLDITAHARAKQHALSAHASQYGRLIDDDPGGFELPAALLSVFQRPYETFLWQSGTGRHYPDA